MNLNIEEHMYLYHPETKFYRKHQNRQEICPTVQRPPRWPNINNCKHNFMKKSSVDKLNLTKNICLRSLWATEAKFSSRWQYAGGVIGVVSGNDALVRQYFIGLTSDCAVYCDDCPPLPIVVTVIALVNSLSCKTKIHFPVKSKANERAHGWTTQTWRRKVLKQFAAGHLTNL